MDVEICPTAAVVCVVFSSGASHMPTNLRGTVGQIFAFQPSVLTDSIYAQAP